MLFRMRKKAKLKSYAPITICDRGVVLLSIVCNFAV